MNSKNKENIFSQGYLLNKVPTPARKEFDIYKNIDKYQIGKNGLFLPSKYVFSRSRPKWLKILHVISWFSIILCAVFSYFSQGIVINIASLLSFISLFVVFIGNNYYNSPFRNSKSFLKKEIANFIYNTLLMLCSLCFLRLTLVLPSLMKESNSQLAVLQDSSSETLSASQYNQYVMFSDSYIYSFPFFVVIFFFIIRVILNSMERKKKYKEFCESSISKWNYTLGTWFGLFTIFSTIAILGVG